MQAFKRKLTVLLIGAFSALMLAVALAPAVAHAQTDPFKDICSQSGASASSVCHASGANNLSGSNGLLIKVANIFAFVTGVAAVFVIMIGGFTYITSNGDAGKASGGKNAVLFACIGLLVVVVGRAIIGFVVTKLK
jgi:hypothetical protein